MAYAGGQGVKPAVGALDKLAANPVQTVNYVPPPFSGQQGNFQPLIGDQPQHAPAQPVTTQQPAPAPAEGNKSILDVWGIPDTGDAPAMPADTASPSRVDSAPKAQNGGSPSQQDILKVWGIPDNNSAPASSSASNPPSSQETIGSTIGGYIDKGVGLADKYGTPVLSMGNNLIRQIGTGVPVIGGALNKADAATNALIAPAINPLLPDSWKLQGGTFGERYQNALAQQNGQDQQFQSDHPVLSTGAQIAGGVGSLGGLASAVPAVGTALGMSGSLGTRTALGALSGAALGGADAGVRSDGDPEAIKHGAMLGGGLGLITPTAGKLIGAGVNKLLGGNIPERVAQLAQLARDKYGINVGPGQLSTNPTIKFLDSVVNRLPMSGGTAAKEAQQTAFNSAVARSFGAEARAVTPEVVEASKARLGKVFDSVAERTPAIKADGQFQDDILNTFKEAEQTLQSSEIEPLRKMMLGVVQKYKEGGNSIDGETYQALTRKGAPLDRLMNSNDPNIAYSAGQIRDALDGTLERSAPPAALSDLRTARSQWKALKTVEPLAAKSATGDISPALLMGQASKSYGTASYGKGSDLVDLARIGQQFLKEAPSSGSAERIQLNNMLLGSAGAGGAGAGVIGLMANPGAIPLTLGGLAGTAAIARGLGTVLRSPYLGKKMIQNSLGTGVEDLGNMLLRGAPQGGLPTYQRQPLELTVRKPGVY